MDRRLPESYDRRALLEFVARAKEEAEHLEVPVYSISLTTCSWGRPG